MHKSNRILGVSQDLCRCVLTPVPDPSPVTSARLSRTRPTAFWHGGLRTAADPKHGANLLAAPSLNHAGLPGRSLRNRRRCPGDDVSAGGFAVAFKKDAR